MNNDLKRFMPRPVSTRPWVHPTWEVMTGDGVQVQGVVAGALLVGPWKGATLGRNPKQRPIKPSRWKQTPKRRALRQLPWANPGLGYGGEESRIWGAAMGRSLARGREPGTLNSCPDT